ncbi:uncharacterized protein LOC119709526 [Motacilla alba alba]|uniref:uncharacterized protein LOC119709526 n=1 Tax=Motacilla alba alba TaxID=1094192 RepID=UPI0018D52DA8|nr:uncharacterized protein LOC119709526 [Motacilla alba alba]
MFSCFSVSLGAPTIFSLVLVYLQSVLIPSCTAGQLIVVICVWSCQTFLEVQEEKPNSLVHFLGLLTQNKSSHTQHHCSNLARSESTGIFSQTRPKLSEAEMLRSHAQQCRHTQVEPCSRDTGGAVQQGRAQQCRHTQVEPCSRDTGGAVQQGRAQQCRHTQVGLCSRDTGETVQQGRAQQCRHSQVGLCSRDTGGAVQQGRAQQCRHTQVEPCSRDTGGAVQQCSRAVQQRCCRGRAPRGPAPPQGEALLQPPTAPPRSGSSPASALHSPSLPRSAPAAIKGDSLCCGGCVPKLLGEKYVGACLVFSALSAPNASDALIKHFPRWKRGLCSKARSASALQCNALD